MNMAALVLTALEELETAQINLGLYSTDVGIDALYNAAVRKEASLTQTEVEARLRTLIADGEVIEWRAGAFRSRIAETVRILRLLRQRFWTQRVLADAPLLVDDVRVEFRSRRRPNWAAAQLAEVIPNEVPAATAQAFQAAVGFPTISRFQAEALQQIFACAQRLNPDKESFIVAGDTGAGKTEAFLFPILLDIASEPPDQQRQAGVRAVLVYPRIRLARNQLARLLRYTTQFEASGGPRLTIGIQNGDVPSGAGAICARWTRRQDESRNWHQVPLLESCIQGGCGVGRYWVAADDPAIDTSCPRLICDACGHTIETLHITQAALAVSAPHLLVITDVSLSQWLTREKYSHLWGLWQGETVTVPPRFLVLDEVHLYERLKGAHIARLIKRFQARVQLVTSQNLRPGSLRARPIVIGVSATLHDERRFLAKLLDIKPEDDQDYARLKVIKPAEADLDLTGGRERYIFIYPRTVSPTPRNPEYRVTDQTAAIQIVMAAMHNLKTDEEWRGLAFFDSINDLRQFQYNYAGDGGTTRPIGRSTGPQEMPPANDAELWRIRTDQRRNGAPRPRCGGTCEDRARDASLYECPHFRAGDCWIFARQSGWDQPLRVASSVYAGSAAQLDGKDLIPTSPSLEVGYDDEDIHLVYQHKAPPNAASFIQRRGRAGRNPQDSPVIITLLWPHRRDDPFYFFRPQALYDPAFDDAPLNASNFNVQRTHTLLAFFDLLACLRRQNVNDLRDDHRILDFTQAGGSDLASELIQSWTRLPDPKRPGQQRFLIKHLETKKRSIWISGKPVERGWVRDIDGTLHLRGWLAMEHDLALRILAPVWDQFRRSDLFMSYLNLSEIASLSFQQHRSYPFLSPLGSMPSMVRQFGDKMWHSSHDQAERSNWVKTYRHIDWMLQGNEAATTLTIHYPLPPNIPASEDELEDRTVDVTFAVTELLPGNVSYRLREPSTIHWTPIPPDGTSTFCYPEHNVLDDEGMIVGGEAIGEYLPVESDITSRPESIFGVPRYLDDRFPGLPFMTLRRLRAETFGAPNQQFSPNWVFVPNDAEPNQGFAIDTSQPGVTSPPGAFAISRRSSARASSVIIPYVMGHRPAQRQLLPPLNTLFTAIDGFLEVGSGLLGYTRVFYEMQIDVKGERANQNVSLNRLFYPPIPQRDDAGRPKAILVGYPIETQGIRFEISPDLLTQAVAAIVDDEGLRLHLRRSYALYRMASHATEWGIFMRQLLEDVGVVVDYWLHEVVPSSVGTPRLLSAAADLQPMLTYYQARRIVRHVQVGHLRETLLSAEGFFEQLNHALELAFKDSPEFQTFVESVVLHSLAAQLKNLIARLGGVGSGDLVAYADMPLLDQVDRSIYPRILIMDTVEGGSGGIAQAFERLDLTDNEGSLWWTLQTELGSCPIASGEALIRAVLTRASVDQIHTVRTERSEDALQRLLDTLDLPDPAEEALRALGRTIFSEIDIATEGQGSEVVPILIMHELFSLQQEMGTQMPGGLSRVAIVRIAAQNADQARRPHIAALRTALQRSGVAANDLDHELALQLLAIYMSVCDDGCPVCLSADSDIEHYHLAPLLNSRQTLHKLREILFSRAPTGDCLAALADSLRMEEVVQVEANPGSLGDRLDPSLGLAIVPHVDQDGQIRSAAAVVVDREKATDFLSASDGWERRWGADQHKPFVTPGGVRVRSRGEYIIATTLESRDIAFEYEARLAYRDDDGRTKYIHPDFHLYEHNLYVEYWGRDDPNYIESRRFKERVYTRRGIEIIAIEDNDLPENRYMDTILARMTRV